MKKKLSARDMLMPILTFLFFVPLISCNNNAANTPPAGNDTAAKMADDKNDAKFNKAEEKDAKAVVEAYTSSLTEQRTSDSVAQYTTNDDVKMLATTMAAAHTALNSNLTDLATKEQISLPTDLSTSDMDKINKLVSKKQRDMNKDYVDELISAHKDAIAFFDKTATETTDSTIRTLFVNTLPVLRKHLDMATDCKNKLKSME